jgi:hypothetical protein
MILVDGGELLLLPGACVLALLVTVVGKAVLVDGAGGSTSADKLPVATVLLLVTTADDGSGSAVVVEVEGGIRL